VDEYLEEKFGKDGEKFAPIIVPAILKALADQGYKVPSQQEWDALKKADADNAGALAGIQKWMAGMVKWGRQNAAVAWTALILAMIAILLAIWALLRRRVGPQGPQGVPGPQGLQGIPGRDGSGIDEEARRAAADAGGRADEARRRVDIVGAAALLAGEAAGIDAMNERDGGPVMARLRELYAAGPRD